MNAAGLRGAGAAEYVAGYKTIAAQAVQRGQTLQPGELGADVGSLVSAGRALGGSKGQLFQNAAGLQRYASMAQRGNVSGKFSGLYSGVGDNLIMMDALRQSQGDIYKAYELSNNMTLKQKRDAIFRSVQGDANRRRTFMGMGYKPAEIDALMSMSDSELPANRRQLAENLKGQTLSAARAEAGLRDAAKASEGKQYGLAKQIEISEQVLRENMMSNAKLERIIQLLQKEDVGGKSAAARREAKRQSGK
jgi:hypothetical protein